MKKSRPRSIVCVLGFLICLNICGCAVHRDPRTGIVDFMGWGNFESNTETVEIPCASSEIMLYELTTSTDCMKIITNTHFKREINTKEIIVEILGFLGATLPWLIPLLL